MTICRQTLPNRRRCETLEIEHAGHRFSLTFSRYHDGRPAEIFLSSRHIGSPLEAIARDAAVTVSLALQHGAPLATISGALTKNNDGSPATLLGATLDAITEASR
jgi:ribonucleoside-diphosphate reductase alpha chain